MSRSLTTACGRHVKGAASFHRGSAQPREESSSLFITSADTSPCWMIHRAPGKGFGVFATRNILISEVIMDEPPIATFAREVYESDVILERAFLELPRSQQWRILALSDSNTMSPSVVGIIRTNGFGGRPNSFIYESLSRINHSCIPNAVVDDDQVIALRDIAVGEEITISYYYYHDEKPVKQRKRKLLNGWKIDCNCEACQFEEMISQRMDCEGGTHYAVGEGNRARHETEQVPFEDRMKELVVPSIQNLTHVQYDLTGVCTEIDPLDACTEKIGGVTPAFREFATGMLHHADIERKDLAILSCERCWRCRGRRRTVHWRSRSAQSSRITKTANRSAPAGETVSFANLEAWKAAMARGPPDVPLQILCDSGSQSDL
ncbi:hypothetical protein MRB53_040337 [Persea americana]|nr:hypothetical protein MRB53_040337 [Persea americana]